MAKDDPQRPLGPDRTWRAPFVVQLMTLAPVLAAAAIFYVAGLPAQRLHDLVVIALIGGEVAAYLYLFGSTRVTYVAGERSFRIVNILTVRRVPACTIAAVQRESGLQFRTQQDDVLVWQGMGASLLRTWTGNKSARVVAADLDAVVAGATALTGDPGTERVVTGVRSAVWWIGFAYPLMLAVTGTVIHALTH